MVTSYTYNALGEISDLANRKLDSTLLSEFSGMSYDGAANLLSQTNSIPSAPTYSGSTAFQYDVKDQLVQESSTRLGGYTNNFAYDSAGNATNFKGLGNLYNSNNQDTANTFDLAGNPTVYRGVSCTYDAENHMIAYGSLLSAGYLAEGLRAWKQTAAGRKYYVYADKNTPICECDSLGNVQRVYTVGPHGLVAEHDQNGSTFLTFDCRGNTVQRVNAAGNVAGTSMSDVFGSTVSTDASVDPYSGYGGQWGYYTDHETGLQLLGCRYYDPSTGQFVTRDPIEYDGGINLYAYCQNDPVGGTDPDGEQASLETCNKIHEKIKEIEKQLNERQDELRENIGRLPGKCKGDNLRGKPSRSRRGHIAIMNDLKAKLAMWKLRLFRECGGDNPDPLPEPVADPIEIRLPRPEPRLVVFGCTFTGAALIGYLIISEGSRLCPPRNLIPIP